MPAEKYRKPESRGLEPYRHRGWLSPFERMEDVFEDFFRRPFERMMWPGVPRTFEETVPSPSVDIYEEGDDIVLKSELPGMTKDDIEVNMTDDTIILSGEKKEEEKVEDKNYYRHERSYGSFSRSFSLPAEVQSDKVSAKFKDGILEIRAPRSETAKRKEQKIKIE